MTLKLEDGQHYRDGTGVVRTVRLVDDRSQFPFEAEGEPYRYMADGRYVPEKSATSVYDLVALVPAATSVLPKGTIQ
jgi:hypothetical protein